MTTHAARPYQTTLIGLIYAAWTRVRNVLAVLPTGGGKCLARDTPVMLHDGRIVPVQDVKVGDQLMGPDSKPRRVRSLARGREEMWRVTPHKGDAYTVNESHILSLKMTGNKCVTVAPDGTRLAPGDVHNLSVRDYLRASKTFKHCAKTWRTAVEFPTATLPLPPYILGAWLGDGTSIRAEITTGDPEIYREFGAYARSVGMQADIRPNSPGSYVVQLHTAGKAYGRGGSPMGNALRSLNLIGNKHIPHVYLTADREQRLEVLAGIIDTDGHHAGKGFDLTLKSERLMRDVVQLARSLGFSATPRTVQKTCGNNGVVGTYWTCHINGPVDEVPCRVPRKQAPPRRQKKDVLVSGFTLEPQGVGDYYGFEIDGDRLFLLGDTTVTHNTFCFASIIAAFAGATCAVAHRKELVVQMSLALAREGVRHRVIGSDKARKACIRAHLKHFKRSFYDPNSQHAVAGVDTLIKADKDTQAWLQRVGLWVMDECHHVLKGNKWGKAVAMMPNAFGLGVTATPTRADGMGLGDHHDGVFHEMVLGPSMRELIELGYLCDYRYVCPPSDINLAQVAISANGDFAPMALKKARRDSSITGDVVKHYLQYARGKRGITFDTDVESATDTAAAYRLQGVRAEVVSGDTPDDLRDAIIERFRNGELDQLVNVDLFGEGFDVPDVEVVSFARPTMSLSLFIQQAGRALRILDGKICAIIIDHVGNLVRHLGPPDKWRVWTLDRREKASRGTKVNEVPMRTCLNPVCFAPFERFHVSCPFCGWVPEISQRSAPSFVDGDLFEVDADTLARLRAAVAAVDGAPYIPANVAPDVGGHMRRRHWDKQQAQGELRRVLDLWGGWQTHLGLDTRQVQKKFYLQYGLDVLTARTLSGEDVEKLRLRIESQLNEYGVVEA